jgi:hypothetical protein
MSEEASSLSSPSIESPPPAPQPARAESDDARSHLHRLAQQLIRAQNRRLLIEFLTLRRALR